MSATGALCDATLARLPEGVGRPGYDRSKLLVGAVHFGPGAFHRVHQAGYLDSLLERDPRYGLCEVALRSPGVRDALAPQDGLYTIAILGEETRFRVIGAVRELLVAHEAPQAVIERLAARPTRLVSSTITEKGYCLRADGELDFTHPDIAADLARPDSPTSFIGYLVRGFALRRERGLPPFTVLCCDNLADNGQRVRSAVVRLAHEFDPELSAWIGDCAAFPRTMIDSITPATDDVLRTRVAEALGVADRWPVQREDFVQWVIEDDPRSCAADLAPAGVTLTNDIRGFERAKLRLLNGPHSTLAYLGLHAGHETVAGAMRDPALAGFIREMMIHDIKPTIEAPRGLDLAGYIDDILARFRNPAMRHLLSQIAWDGSQKLPIRLLGTMRDLLALGRPIERPAMGLAAWMQFIRRRSLAGIDIVDPLSRTLAGIGQSTDGNAAHDVPLFLALESVFPRDLATDARFCAAVIAAYEALGARHP